MGVAHVATIVNIIIRHYTAVIILRNGPERNGTVPAHYFTERTLYSIPAKYTGFPGIIPGFSVSSRNPEITANYPGFERLLRNPGISPWPALIVQHSHVHMTRTVVL